MKTHFLIFFFLSAIVPLYADINPPKIDVRIVAVDEAGNPVPGANCMGSFNDSNGILNLTGMTNEKGIFQIAGRTFSAAAIGVSKDGFYETLARRDFDQSKMYQAADAGHPLEKWQSDPLEMKIVLKKILHPIPMYAKHVEADIPKDDEAIGFDLEKGDWVKPYGKGEIADFYFMSIRHITSPKQWDASLVLTFVNPGDGIQDFYARWDRGSALISPHLAPVDGYRTQWSQIRTSSTQREEKEDQNYIFRVRTTFNAQGQAIGGLYGKIYGDIKYFCGINDTGAGIGFTYYLNPTQGNPNIEFDPEHNLFPGLKSVDAVTKP